MFNFLIDRALDASARRHGGDVAYLKALYAASPGAFRKFAAVSKLSGHREAASSEACCAARLVGALVEDCGPCTQIVVNMARHEGVEDAQIEAVLTADMAAMSADTALGYRFAEAVVSRSVEAVEARAAVRARWGEKGVIDLTLALQVSRLFPMLKAGLGYAVACQQVSVGTRTVPIARHAV